MNNNGQAFIFGAVALLVGLLIIIIYSLLSPVMKEFIDMGVNSSEEHDDSVTKFFISLIPAWILLLIVGYVLFMIFSGGGGG